MATTKEKALEFVFLCNSGNYDDKLKAAEILSDLVNDREEIVAIIKEETRKEVENVFSEPTSKPAE